MPNELPEQLYIVRFTLKCGAVFDVVTSLTRDEVRDRLSDTVTIIPGTNPTKQWPVDVVIYDEVACFIHSPHEQWLAGRKLALQ